jgi:hypothetical protein
MSMLLLGLAEQLGDQGHRLIFLDALALVDEQDHGGLGLRGGEPTQ